MAVARWLSIVAHPFVMIGVMVGTAAAARQTIGEALRAVVVVVLFTVLPLLLVMRRSVRSGAWENPDASNPRERPLLYLVGALSLMGLLAYLIVVRPQSFMMRGVVATLGMFVVCAIATRWIKVSLHMAFGALAASTLALMGSVVGYVLILILPAVAWARLALKRHTPLEVALGTVAGAAAGTAIHYL
jgi:hypothetical protein